MWVDRDRDASTNSVVARKFESNENIYDGFPFQRADLKNKINLGIKM